MSHAWPGFDADGFLGECLPRIDALELMQRGQLIAAALNQHLPRDFAAASPIFAACLPGDDRPGLSGWALLSFNQYVAAYGLAHPDLSLALLKSLTPHFTAEFGIRPFIHADQDRALATIATWTNDPNHHVRRLASEGTRPRLPWAMRLPRLVADPGPFFPILTALLDDPEDYVRRSVANSLNDIAKDHPDRIAAFVARHIDGASPERRRLLKHASRTLLKAGHGKALANFGFAAGEGLRATLSLEQPVVTFGSALAFGLELANETSEPQSLMIDYVIHHQKANGSLSPKVFKWTVLELAAGASVQLQRRHAMRPITTRRYHAGAHRLDVAVNGAVLATAEFALHMPDPDQPFAAAKTFP